MVDIQARREMAVLVRKFARGGLTVEEFEAQADALADRDSVVYDCTIFTWYFYCDFRTERMVGKWRLDRASRRLWAAFVLFLMTSSSDYDVPHLTPNLWPTALPLLYTVAAVVVTQVSLVAGLWALGGAYAANKWGIQAWQSAFPPEEVEDYWPFPTREEFTKAISLSNPFARAA